MAVLKHGRLSSQICNLAILLASALPQPRSLPHLFELEKPQALELALDRGRASVAGLPNCHTNGLQALQDAVRDKFSDARRNRRRVRIDMHARVLRLDKNGEKLGVVDDPEFARAYLGVWFGKRPCNPELVKQVFGK